MTDAAVLAGLTAILAAHFDVPPTAIAPATRLADDLQADSLDLVALLVAVEDAYGVVVTDAEAAAFDTVGAAAGHVAAALAAAA